MLRTSIPLLIASSLLLGSSASAQIASAVLREGDTLPSVMATVTSIDNTGVNQVGGYAATIGDSNGRDHVWGDPAGGGSPTVLRTESTIGGLTQTSFESFFGIADLGEISYSASGTGGPAGGFDSVWLDSTPVAVEGDPTGFDMNFWRFASRPGVTAGGTPYFVGGVTSTVGGATENRGLYFGLPAMPVMQGGDNVPGLPFPLSVANTVDFDYRYSADATHLLAPVQMDTGSTADDGALTLDVQGLVLGGTLVREGNLVPLSVGGDGVENWDNFDFCGVTEAGELFFTGDTDGDAATDEFVLKNGVMLYREGDVLDGQLLTGAIEGAFMNEGGELAFIWDVDSPAGSLEALFVEGQLVLTEGEPVDWDGDGAIDAGTAVTSFTGISALTVSPNRRLYFTADVDVAGVVLEGMFCLPYDGLLTITPYCAGDGSGATPCPCGNESAPGSGEGCANSTGVGALLTAAGSTSVAADDLVLTVSNATPFQSGIVYAAEAPLEFVFGDGLRCAGVNAVRFPVEFADMNGSYSAANVASYLGVVAGDVRYAQGWYRDPVGGPCASTFNLSSALELMFLP